MAHDESQLPLTGVRVADLTRNLAGPYCTMMLGDMGAEVIKVEPPNGGDETRRLFRFPGRAADSEDLFGMFNRNKRSVVWDLKSEHGKALLKALVRKSDIFVSNSAPGAIHRLGFGYESVKALNPRMVYVTISGFGPDDPRRAMDGVVQAASGVMDLTGPPGGPPMPAGLHMGDLAASLFAAYATVSALIRAMRTGEGTRIDVAMTDALLALHTGAAAQYFTTGTYPRGSMANSVYRVPSAVFQTADDRHVFLLVNNEIWPRFCQALSLDSLAADARFATNQERVANRAELTDLISRRIRELPLPDVLARLTTHEVPHAAVATLAEALDGEYAAQHEMVLTIEGELRGGREPIRVMGIPYKMSGTRPGVRFGPPALGEANAYVAREILGLCED